MKNNKFQTFLTGALVGVGLGLLLAPFDGSETKKELKSSLNELLDSVKNVDIEASRALFMKRLSQIQDDLNDLSDDAKVDLIKKRLTSIAKTCDDLASVAMDNDFVKVKDAAMNVKSKTKEIMDALPKKKVDKKPVKKKNK